MKVTLIGAGPGDPKLMTVKAMEAIKDAEVVLFDRLVGSEILSFIPDDAEMIDVGKRVNNHPVPQEEISNILLKKALEGKNVIRLKGGDSFVFGRGGEELELLAENNVPFEVIPGITSSIAGALYAGIPVTHRDYASSFHVITGHAKNNGELDIDFEALVRTKGTLVFMMSVSTLNNICNGCITAGMDKDMPAAIVENATTSKQRKFIGTVSTLTDIAKENSVISPSVIIIGKVCLLSEKLDWYSKKPLLNKNIIVTRARCTSSKLIDGLKELGSNVLELPTIKFSPELDGNIELLESIKNIRKYSWLVFTSVTGVNLFFDYLIKSQIDIRDLHHLKIATVGSATKNALEDRGLMVDYMPSAFNSSNLAEGLVEKLNEDDEVLILRAKLGSKQLLDIFEKNSVTYKNISIYDTVMDISEKGNAEVLFEKNKIDFITFSSSSTVEGFVNIFENYDFGDVRCICIGEQTATTAKKYGFNIVMSDKATIDSMILKIKELS